MLSAGSRDRRTEAEVRAVVGTFVAGKFGVCSVQEHKNFLCSEDVGAVAGDD